jgi:hypothetical protein
MKQLYPQIGAQMLEIELYIAGLEPGGEIEEDPNGSTTEEGIVL